MFLLDACITRKDYIISTWMMNDKNRVLPTASSQAVLLVEFGVEIVFDPCDIRSDIQHQKRRRSGPSVLSLKFRLWY